MVDMKSFSATRPYEIIGGPMSLSVSPNMLPLIALPYGDDGAIGCAVNKIAAQIFREAL